MDIKKYIVDPFHFIKIERTRSYLWILFTLIFGLFGIGFNVWDHLTEQSLYEAIVQEFRVNSFYTFSIVLLASSAGSLFMKLDKDKMLMFSDIKLWLIVLFFIFLFISFFLSQSKGRILHYNWVQLIYFVLAIVISIYNFCVLHLDEHPDKFAHLLGDIDDEKAENLKRIIDKSKKTSVDKQGNKL